VFLGPAISETFQGSKEGKDMDTAFILVGLAFLFPMAFIGLVYAAFGAIRESKKLWRELWDDAS
jgi:hypothetical protein